MKYVTYYRVSTRKQDLGLQAQQTIIKNYLNPNDEVVATFTEKETGTNKRIRLELQKAIKTAKTKNATLLIAKLDRLARNVAFVSTLMESGVEFKALDMPEADRFTIHIFSALAEKEANLISTRTKQALAELKKRGVKLGKPENFTQAGRDKGVATNKAKAKANENNRKALAYITLCIQAMGNLNYTQIAKLLNESDFKTSQGKQFQAVQVQRLMG